jgi:hypothetical protein
MRCLKQDCTLEAEDNSNYCEIHQPRLEEDETERDEIDKKENYRRIIQSS